MDGISAQCDSDGMPLLVPFHACNNESKAYNLMLAFGSSTSIELRNAIAALDCARVLKLNFHRVSYAMKLGFPEFWQ
jgi:hypothetical protein